MEEVLASYENLLGKPVTDQLVQLAALLQGMKIVHVNSTKEGGGVAEILSKMVPLTNALGIDARWEVIFGDPEFFQCTKMLHNSLQDANSLAPNSALFQKFEEINKRNAEVLRESIQSADIVFIHDPQPLPLINYLARPNQKWIWRCHIDVSVPSSVSWNYLKQYIEKYDASIFSLEDFVKPLPHPVYLIPPSIDPLSEKNIELDHSEVASVYKNYGIDINRPVLLQVSRFDQFKDPIGVIKSYKIAKKYCPDLQLVLAGGGASDDPEGELVLNEVRAYAKDDLDIHIIFLPATAHRVINALQRGATLIIQKSLKEGFGLTVSEGLWKGKPVIGGNVGGIRLQVIDHHTGFLVNTVQGAADRIRYLLQNPKLSKELGNKGHKHVKENFLLVRHLKEYLTLVCTLINSSKEKFLE